MQRIILLIIVIFSVTRTKGQIQTSDIDVHADHDVTKIQYEGSDRLTVHDSGVEVSGDLAITSLSRKLVKGSGSSISYNFTLGNSPGIWNTGHIELWIASIGNSHPRYKALYSIQFQVLNNTAYTYSSTLISGSSFGVGLSFNGLVGTLTIPIPDGGAAERMITSADIMCGSGVISLD